MGNAVMMGAIGFLSLILLILVESNLCVCIKNLTFRPLPNPKEDLDLDEDVIAEADRLERTKN